MARPSKTSGKRMIPLRAITQRLRYSRWLFHLHGAVKIQPFSPVFPLAGATAKTFCWLSLWNFKESINHFLWRSLFKKFILDSCHAAFIAKENVSLPEVYCMWLDVWALGRGLPKRSPSSLLPSSQCRGKGRRLLLWDIRLFDDF